MTAVGKIEVAGREVSNCNFKQYEQGLSEKANWLGQRPEGVRESAIFKFGKSLSIEADPKVLWKQLVWQQWRSRETS